jgi:hypothetical protein
MKFINPKFRWTLFSLIVATSITATAIILTDNPLTQTKPKATDIAIVDPPSNNTPVVQTQARISTPIPQPTTSQSTTSKQQDKEERKIQLALLLDSSGSMEGLLEQAKSQLWNIVSTLSKAKYKGTRPKFEIALYEYGNNKHGHERGYIKELLPLTSDLNLLSMKLFNMYTDGSVELCGQVLQEAVYKLKWSDNPKDIKLIFIAGNEEFNQGYIQYEAICADARKRGIVVNTIHCGTFDDGIHDLWQSAAMVGSGDYMSINHNEVTQYISTPWDKRINELGIELNSTYISYGAQGTFNSTLQTEADESANIYGWSNSATRSVYKASPSYYNGWWDLVDASKDINFDLNKIDKKTLPENLQNKTNKEIQEKIRKEEARRDKIRAEIQELSEKRDKYIAAKRKDQKSSVEYAILKAIEKQAEAKGFDL